jgi:hypothetical protein
MRVAVARTLVGAVVGAAALAGCGSGDGGNGTAAPVTSAAVDVGNGSTDSGKSTSELQADYLQITGDLNSAYDMFYEDHDGGADLQQLQSDADVVAGATGGFATWVQHTSWPGSVSQSTVDTVVREYSGMNGGQQMWEHVATASSTAEIDDLLNSVDSSAADAATDQLRAAIGLRPAE